MPLELQLALLAIYLTVGLMYFWPILGWLVDKTWDVIRVYKVGVFVGFSFLGSLIASGIYAPVVFLKILGV